MNGESWDLVNWNAYPFANTGTAFWLQMIRLPSKFVTIMILNSLI